MKLENQTILEKIKPLCDALPERMKRQKENLHLTNQEISDLTGVPMSNIGKFFSSSLERPCVYNVAATCIALDLSLDELLGIAAQQESRETELQREIDELKTHLEYERRDRDNIAKVAKTRERIIFGLIVAVVILDICVANAGWILR